MFHLIKDDRVLQFYEAEEPFFWSAFTLAAIVSPHSLPEKRRKLYTD